MTLWVSSTRIENLKWPCWGSVPLRCPSGNAGLVVGDTEEAPTGASLAPQYPRWPEKMPWREGHGERVLRVICLSEEDCWERSARVKRTSAWSCGCLGATAAHVPRVGAASTIRLPLDSLLCAGCTAQPRTGETSCPEKNWASQMHDDSRRGLVQGALEFREGFSSSANWGQGSCWEDLAPHCH